jgi:hypothetical protein
MYIYHPDGRLASQYSAYDEFLGIKSVEWSPSGQLLTIGSYDSKVILINGSYGFLAIIPGMLSQSWIIQNK